MKLERLRAMLVNAIAFDTETHKVQPGLLAPPLVCASVATWDPVAGRPRGQLLDKDAARAWFGWLLDDPSVTIVGANIAYDMLVMAADAAARGVDLMPKILAAYEAERVYDLQIAEALHAVSTGYLGKDPRTSSDPRSASPLQDPTTKKRGRYSLAICTDLVLGRADAKVNDRFRFSYALLEDTPLAEWPPDAQIYPVDDACNTLEVALAQAGLVARPAAHEWPELVAQRCIHCGIGFRFSGLPPCGARCVANSNLHNLGAQCYAALAMHLGAAWGFRVDPAAVETLAARVTASRAEDLQLFLDAGLLKMVREKGTDTTLKGVVHKDLRPGKATGAIKRRVAIAYGCSVPCRGCAGSGKVPSTKTKNLIGCKECASTGLDLSSAPVPRTDGSEAVGEDGETVLNQGVGTGRDTLTESGDEVLIDFAAFSEEAKILETYVPFLRQGIDDVGRPRPITLRPNVLLDTGRASYGDVVQQLPRGGGVRECIVSRPGHVLCSCDYGGLELATHAQSCIWIVGWSKLAEALNKGIKVHDALGATMIGEQYAPFVAKVKAGDKGAKNVRQASKPANFGFPGGMGAVKLVLQQRKQGPDTVAPNGRKYKGLRFCVLVGGEVECGARKVTEWKRKQITPTCVRCIECAEDIRAKWFLQWPENDDYFTYISDVVDNGQIVTRDGRETRLATAQIMQHVSRRLRGGVEFCAAANGYFQGLASDGAKLALTRTTREQYDASYRLPDGRRSPLFGTRTILFAHDELIVEMADEIAAEASARLSVVMIEAMRVYTPDVAVEAPPALMRRWYKGADTVRHAGKLVPWTPEHDEKTCAECRA